MLGYQVVLTTTFFSELPRKWAEIYARGKSLVIQCTIIDGFIFELYNMVMLFSPSRRPRAHP